MALFGRKKKSTKAQTKSTKKQAKKTQAKASPAKKKTSESGQSAEAQAVLAKMKAKSDAGDCAFC